MSRPRGSSLSVVDDDWDIQSRASVFEDESDRQISDIDENAAGEDPAEGIVPVGAVNIPDTYHPPSEFGDFEDQRRLDILQRMSGINNLIQSPGDYYVEQMGKLMDECDQLNQNNLYWATGIKYVNKILALVVIILGTVGTILSIKDENYATAIVIALGSGIVTLREIFNIDSVGIDYFNQAQYVLQIKHFLLDTLARDNVDNHALRYAVKQARKEIDNVKAKVYISSYGPRGTLTAEPMPSVNSPVPDNTTDVNNFEND